MENEREMMSEFLVKLQSYDIFTLQASIYDKLLTLYIAHCILPSENSPAILKEKLSADIAKNDKLSSSFLRVKNGRKNQKYCP